MFEDDNETRTALRTITDVPAPPIATTADQVIRRGRRRTLVHRTGAVAAVVAVVAGIGVGATLLAGPTTGDGNTPATSQAADDPPLPGWTWVDLPESDSCQGQEHRYPDAELGPPPRALVTATFVGAVEDVTGKDDVELVEDHWPEPRDVGPQAYLEVNFSMGDGPGMVRLRPWAYTGTPTEAADLDAARYNACVPPSRHVLADGTVLQLYQPQGADSAQPSQILHVYLPNGRLYVVITGGFGHNDHSPGRGRLPLDDTQLVEVGTRMAAFGQ